MNLCRFLRCDVFFFGTARNIDSHISEIIGGRLKANAEGSVIEINEGSGLYKCCAKSSADLDWITGVAPMICGANICRGARKGSSRSVIVARMKPRM